MVVNYSQCCIIIQCCLFYVYFLKPYRKAYKYISIFPYIEYLRGQITHNAVMIYGATRKQSNTELKIKKKFMNS